MLPLDQPFDTDAFIAHASQVLIGNYARSNLVMVRGEGSTLWDSTGKRYVDFFAGFGGAVLGHANPDLVKAVTEQVARLWHVGNTFHSVPQVEFADRLNRTAFPGKAFFCHSGLEANEAAVKLARLRGLADGGKKWKTISLTRSFHGRSLAMIAATGNPAVKEGFGPAVPGFTNVDPMDYDAIVAAIDDETCCILMEPIQGEGGINIYPDGHAAKIRKLCDERGLTLIFDEVWCCGGRTGKMFGHQWFTTADHKPVLPDIMTLGKAIGGGLPVGAMYAKPEIAALLVPGRHGCTLGGNLICMNVAKTIFDVIERDHLLDAAKRLGDVATKALRSDARVSSKIKEVRGRGLFIGIELNEEPKDFMAKSLERGVILNLTAKKVIRLAPALNISLKEFDEGLSKAIDVIASF
jgi:acetylornithine/N-succinyldiaminopimelate aminotransferase